MCTCRRHYFRMAVCTCRCDHIGRHRASKHRADRHEDSCSLACEASHEGLGNCATYVGRHRGEAS